jgi:TolB-like protein/Tfp pilus assembly protein PilF
MVNISQHDLLATPEVPPSNRTSRQFPPHWRLFGLAVLGLLGLSLWLRFTTPVLPEPAPVPVRPNSVAVVPFVNTNPDPADDYLGRGVASELTRVLRRLSGLRVTDRSSAFAGGDRDPVDWGRHLRVGTVLEGTIRRAGDRLRLTVHLVDVEQGFDLWSETYERRAADLLEIQAEIVDGVLGALRLAPGFDSTMLALRHLPDSYEAYDAYLAGIYWLESPDPAHTPHAVAALNRAIQVESSFALAHAALAEAHVPSSRGTVAPREAVRATEAAALRALALDSTLAGPHRTLGSIRFGYDRDWAAAEAEYRKALALDPGAPENHQAYSRFLLAMGRREESLRAGQDALALSPASSRAIGHLGWYYLHTRQPDLARQALSNALELDSTDWRAHFDLALLEQIAGNYDSAWVHLNRAGALAPNRVDIVAAGAQLQAHSGEARPAVAILRQLADTTLWGYVSPYYVAWIQSALGQRNAAFAALARAVRERSELVPFLPIDPRLDSLRGDPRFRRLLRQLRLPQPRASATIPTR